jgi:hypothetical protein
MSLEIIESRHIRDIGTPEDIRELEMTFTAKINVRLLANEYLGGYDTNQDFVSFLAECLSEKMPHEVATRLNCDDGEAYTVIELDYRDMSLSDRTGEQ